MTSLKIILDTNFLLIPLQFKVDVFTEINRLCDVPYTLHVLEKSIGELHKIILEQKGIDKRAANLALQLIKAKDLNIIAEDSKKTADEVLLLLAKQSDVCIATQDRELLRALKVMGKRSIGLRQKSHLQWQ